MKVRAGLLLSKAGSKKPGYPEIFCYLVKVRRSWQQFSPSAKNWYW